MGAAARVRGADVTMLDVLPDFPEAFRAAPDNDILALCSERGYLLAALLLSMAVDVLFQPAVREVAQ